MEKPVTAAVSSSTLGKQTSQIGDVSSENKLAQVDPSLLALNIDRNRGASILLSKEVCLVHYLCLDFFSEYE